MAFLCLTGCASTVYRLEGEPITPGGVAHGECEAKDWLVLAPTRAYVTDEKKGTSHPVTGLGLYKVGSEDPESIPDVEGLPPSESVDKKREKLAPYRRRGYVAAGLGIAGLTAIAIGTVLFVSAFGTKRTIDAQGVAHDDSTVNGTKAGAGGITVGVGFGLGIAGLVVNPSHAERTESRADRYVFLDPPDNQKSVEALTKAHNESVRQTCAAGSP